MHTIFAMFRLGVKYLQVLEVAEEPSPPRENNFSRTSPTDNYPPPLSPDKDQPVAVETFEVYERETELVLTCYIMMLDLCLKQVSDIKAFFFIAMRSDFFSNMIYFD